MKLEYSRQFFEKNTQISADLFHAVRRKDGQT